MEIAEIVVHERTNDQSYTLEEWNRLRPLITQLYEQERRTRREIVKLLGEHLNFHINEAMLQYRLCRWNLRKNRTKGAVANIDSSLCPVLSLLKHCHDLTKYYKSPHHQLLVEAIKMEQEQHDPESQINAFAKGLIVFVDKTRDHMEQNAFAYSLCNHLNQALGITESQAGESPVEAWKDPAELQSRDPEYFNSNNNIEQTIVRAVELHGYQELLQLRKALECQVNSASTSRSHGMILEHLRKLEKLIHRIACRDFWKADDQNGFMEHWRFMTDGEAGPNKLYHLFDMLYTLRAFTKWGKQVEAQFITARLGEAFRIPGKPETGTVEESHP